MGFDQCLSKMVKYACKIVKNCHKYINYYIIIIFLLSSTPSSQGYPDGMRVGLVFREIWGDFIVSDRQDISMSRASILFWRSAVSWCRASCKTLGTRTKEDALRKRQIKKWSICNLCITPQCLLPQLFEGFVYVLLQNLLHSFNQLHFFLHLLLHRVSNQLIPTPSLPQCQTLGTDLQRNDSCSQCLLCLLFRLSQHTPRLRLFNLNHFKFWMHSKNTKYTVYPKRKSTWTLDLYIGWYLCIFPNKNW